MLLAQGLIHLYLPGTAVKYPPPPTEVNNLIWMFQHPKQSIFNLRSEHNHGPSEHEGNREGSR